MFHSGHQTGLHVLGMNEGTPPNFKGLQGIGHKGKIDRKRGEKIHKVKAPAIRGHKYNMDNNQRESQKQRIQSSYSSLHPTQTTSWQWNSHHPLVGH